MKRRREKKEDIPHHQSTTTRARSTSRRNAARICVVLWGCLHWTWRVTRDAWRVARDVDVAWCAWKCNVWCKLCVAFCVSGDLRYVVHDGAWCVVWGGVLRALLRLRPALLAYCTTQACEAGKNKRTREIVTVAGRRGRHLLSSSFFSLSLLLSFFMFYLSPPSFLSRYINIT